MGKEFLIAAVPGIPGLRRRGRTRTRASAPRSRGCRWKCWRLPRFWKAHWKGNEPAGIPCLLFLSRI